MTDKKRIDPTKSEIVLFLIERAFRLLEKLVPWLGLGVIFYFTSNMVHDIAGEETIIKFIFEQNFDRLLAYLFGGSGFAYGFYMKKLNARIIERHRDYPPKLEQLIDKGRTSSLLGHDGKTNKEDE